MTIIPRYATIIYAQFYFAGRMTASVACVRRVSGCLARLTRKFVRCLQHEGWLDAMLAKQTRAQGSSGASGAAARVPKPKAKAKGKGKGR